MKVWVNNEFDGVYPVGTGAVVIADTKDDACDFLNMFLVGIGLESFPEQFREMPMVSGQVEILCDGDY